MKSSILTFVSILLIASIKLAAQQLPYMSQLSEARTFWNPAATAWGTSMNLDVFIRQQWLGFKGAPTTGFINYQYPFLDYNMSAGGAVVFDKTGPVSKIGLQLNYAYKLKDVLGEDSQLSLGVTAGAHNYSYNTTNAIVNQSDDPLLGATGNSGFFPSVGAGFHYISDTRAYKADNAFFLGLSYLQAYETNVLVNNLNQKRFRHLVLDFGTRLYGYSGFFEPSFTLNYVNPELLNLLVGAKYEMRDKFWAGLGYSSVNDFNLQGGVILDDFGNRDSKLRAGVLANIGITSAFQDFGPGFELFLRYEFDMD
ncbi:MAG: PorP/SprF family type IX secretion system membrane protein [Saprospiraceae bacterium]|nr:PorP/SprF family type IX secretion system membrane protein [Saprospiraceae bacterium]